MTIRQILQVIPQFRDYVWGGSRLRPGIVPTAEAWVVYEYNRVASGVLSEQTLYDLAVEYGEALLGEWVVKRTGTRFPLLIKLLDCAQWLSLQVHPNDEQAIELEGPGQFGKTEAWHILEAEPGAQVIGGLQPGTKADVMADAIRNGRILDLARYVDVRAGDTIFMPPGTIHALGPGLLIYEVQQTSDLTYRVWDWGRPQTAGRTLHIDKSLAVTNPASAVHVRPMPKVIDGELVTLTRCPYFTLEMMLAEKKGILQKTRGESFHALTVIEGNVDIQTNIDGLRIGKYETVIIPACVGEYSISSLGEARLLKASVEAQNGRVPSSDLPTLIESIS